jgi:hypothetical protein
MVAEWRNWRVVLSLMSAAAGATTAPQQINVADLELSQLAEVKKQLEEACL